MRESLKAVCSLFVIVGFLAALLGWTGFARDASWGLRIGGPVVMFLALAVLLKLHFRADRVPDYRREITNQYFNRNGFCFAFSMPAVEDVAYLEAYFQNQYDVRSLGRIALRPARGFFLGRADIQTIVLEVECAPAAFGVVRLPIPIPALLQGKVQAFEVGASVEYPDGKGRRLRFHDGIHLRRDTNFGDAFGLLVKVAGMAGGSIVLSNPETAKIRLPIGVREDIPDDIAPEIDNFWELGDPPLAAAD